VKNRENERGPTPRGRQLQQVGIIIIFPAHRKHGLRCTLRPWKNPDSSRPLRPREQATICSVVSEYAQITTRGGEEVLRGEGWTTRTT